VGSYVRSPPLLYIQQYILLSLAAPFWFDAQKIKHNVSRTPDGFAYNPHPQPTAKLLGCVCCKMCPAAQIIPAWAITGSTINNKEQPWANLFHFARLTIARRTHLFHLVPRLPAPTI
jgi:hypothetical protein